MHDSCNRRIKRNDVSTAYVVDDSMKLLGVISIDNAIRARKENIPIPTLLIGISIQL